MKYFSVFVLLFAVFVLFASADEAELTAEQVCRQPQLRGRCRALIPRFWYNAEKDACENFGYGGCGGNDNNFGSKEDCETKCLGIKAA